MNIRSEGNKRYQRRKKEKAVELMGGKCQLCGYDKCINALDFHHIDKSTKEHKPARIISNGSWNRIIEELNKCILVCSNCHREIESTDYSFDIKSLVKPFIDRTCLTCKIEFQTRNYDSKFCSIKCSSLNQRKCTRPSKSELEKLIKNTSWVQIGRMFDVSDNAVRKWAKSYNIL